MPHPTASSSIAPNILILTASVGAGHIRAAEAVELALKQLAPDAYVKNVDTMELATAAFRQVYAKSYLDLVNKAPHLLGYFYDLTDRAPSARSKRDQFRMLVERANLTRLNKVFHETHDGRGWDIIVNTHFLPAEIIARLRRKKQWITRRATQEPEASQSVSLGVHASQRRTSSASSALSTLHSALSTPSHVPQHTVVTDFDAHGLWANDPTDQYYVATDEAKISLERWNVNPARPPNVAITGIPIHPSFAQSKDQQVCRAKHGLSPDRPVILLLAGGFGVGPIEQLFEAAMKVDVPGGGGGIHLAVVCGKNEALKKKLSTLAARGGPVPPTSSPPHPLTSSESHPRPRITVIGFTKDMDELMAAADIIISKPGGLTTSEILARGAAMAIVNPIPGQESRNSDYLLEHGAAIKINSASILPHKLNQLLSTPKRLAALRASAKSLGHPQAAFDVARSVLSACR